MNTKAEGGELNMNEQTKEQALDSFVSREIYACQSALIEDGLRQQLFTVDEIYNLYRSFDGKVFPQTVCIRCNCECMLLDVEKGQCENCFEETQEPQEIFEWWLVSSWLVEQQNLAVFSSYSRYSGEERLILCSLPD